MINRFLSYFLTILLLSILPLAHAGPGHDGGHDHGEATKTEASPTSPRVESHTELFELVGVIENGEMTIYVDRYATNEPVRNAAIDIEVGTAPTAIKGKATFNADGTYRFKTELFTKPGKLPMVFTIVAGTDADLLAANLVISDTHLHAASSSTWYWLSWLFVFAAAILGGLYFMRTRRPRRYPVAL